MSVVSEMAKREVYRISKPVPSHYLVGEEMQEMDWADPPAYYFFRAGPHVDPDDGPNYVRVDQPLTPKRRKRIKECKKKVNQIITEMVRQLKAGAEFEDAQSMVLKRQQYHAVRLVASWEEAGAVLTEMYRDEYLLPGSLENYYMKLVAGPRILYGWHEEVSCFGGATDRYTLAELDRLNLH